MNGGIVQAPNPILRLRTIRVKDFDKNLTLLAERMTHIMDASGGVGLAAPQIASALDMAIIRVDENRVLPLVNSQIIAAEGREVAVEGCLSLPGLSVPVARAKRVRIKAQDLSGEEMEVDLEEMAARVAQHELDHLRGRLILDYFWSPENPTRGYSLVQEVI